MSLHPMVYGKVVHRAVVVGVLIVGLVTTNWVALTSIRSTEKLRTTELIRATNAATASIDRSLQAVQLVGRGATAVVAERQTNERAMLRRYLRVVTDGLPLAVQYPGLIALGVVEAREDGALAVMIEPQAAAVDGVDDLPLVLSEELQAARDLGLPIQVEVDIAGADLVVIHPAEGDAAVWVVSLVSRPELLRASMSSTELSVAVSFGSPDGQDVVISNGAATSPEAERTVLLSAGNQTWHLRYLVPPGSLPDGTGRLIAIIVAGVGLSILAAALARGLLRTTTVARSEREAAAERLAVEEARFGTLASSAPVGIFYADGDGGVQYANPLLETMFGGDVTGRRLWERLGCDPDDPAVLHPSEDVESQSTVRTTTGDRILQVSTRPIDERNAVGNTAGWAGTVADVTTEVRARQALEQTAQETHELARRDSLTGLANRLAVVEALEAADADGRRHALLFCDLDGFKSVNDELGHAAGDAVLVEVAQRMTDSVRAPGLVGRLGGDEFAVLLSDLRVGETVAAAAVVVDRITHRMAEPVVVDGHRLAIGVSIGYATSEEGHGPSEIMASADEAMYRAKSTQKRSQVVTAPGGRSDQGSEAPPVLL